MNVRTCSDSGRALFQLLTYYINDGDFPADPQLADSVNINSNMEEELLNLNQQENALSKSQEDQISEMLKEAMEDNTTSQSKI